MDPHLHMELYSSQWIPSYTLVSAYAVHYGAATQKTYMRKKTEKKRGVNTHISVGIFKDSLKACDFY